MNLPLQQRAGANIGVIPTTFPRSKAVKAATLPIVLGDMVLFDGPADGDVRAVGNITYYNSSAIALTVSEILKAADGNETIIHTQVVAAGGVLPVPETTVATVSPTAHPATLNPGEQLILRTTGVGYTGGAFVESGYSDLYGAISTRSVLSTSLATVLKTPPGKSLGALLNGDAPGFLSNTDTANNVADIYVNDGVTDQLVLKGWPIPTGGTIPVPLPALDAGQSVKMALRAPITTAGRTVSYLSLWIMNDEPAEV